MACFVYRSQARAVLSGRAAFASYAAYAAYAALSSKICQVHSLLERARGLLERTRSARGLRGYSEARAALAVYAARQARGYCESWQTRAALAVYAATVSHGRHGMHSGHGLEQEAEEAT